MAQDRSRYRRILRFASHHLAIAWWYEIALPRLGMTWLAERTRDRRMIRFSRAFHALAVELGGLMIKVGQYLSSRLDILPPAITAELEGLQDEVPPVPFDRVAALAEAELGAPLAAVFASVDEHPIAAASLGQAHRARLAAEDARIAGVTDVVLKVQRPGIDDIVATDLAALRRVGGWLRRIRMVRDRVDLPALVEEFATTSLEEIDYLHEAAGSERFAASFAGDERIRVPRVVWERTSRRVLVLEDVTAIKITDRNALRAAGIDPAEVAAVFAEVMFEQLFAHGEFHADPHPGNLFVTPQPGGGWTLTVIDFGMMGRVPTALRMGLRSVLVAAASRDGKGLVAAMRSIGVLLPGADARELERAMTELFARFGGMGFVELREVDPREFRDFAGEFGEVVRELPFQLPPDFLLVVRSMSLTSGVCSALDPAFNLWDAVEPYAARLLRDDRGDLAAELGRSALGTVRSAWALPRRIEGFIDRVEDGSLAVETPAIERRLDKLERTGRRLASAVLAAGLFIGGSIVRPDDTVLGTVLIAVAVLPVLHAVFGGRR